MSSGKKLDVGAESAGEAIMRALQMERGETVVGCGSGAKDRDATNAGWIDYDIPKHTALPLVPEPGQQSVCAGYLKIGDKISVENRGIVEVLEIQHTASMVEMNVNTVPIRLNKRTLVDAVIA